jgi:Ssp1 endopeptidase immunity protein Rap1a
MAVKPQGVDMAGRAIWMLVALAALPLAMAAAIAQNSEYDALPEPVVAAPPPAPAITEPSSAGHPSQVKLAPEPKQKSASEKAAAEKEALAAKKQGAALNAKQDSGKDKDEDLPVRRMAPSAAIPPFPGDEKGPKTIEFLGSCASDYDGCMEAVRDVGEKLSAAELCVPPELYFNTVTERVRKWATLRPDIHNQPAPRVIAAALRSIYPCKHAAPARTAAEKGGPKAAKAAQ